MNEAVPKPQGRILADLAALHKQLARLAKITQRGADASGLGRNDSNVVQKAIDSVKESGPEPLQSTSDR